MAIEEKTIFVVDDEPINLTTVSELLSDKGYRILVTNKSRKAFNLIKNNRPDLVILDIYMPGVNGLEVCRLIRNDDLCREIPVIFLSASEQDCEIAIKAGGDDYIVKPFESEELLKAIGRVLS